MCVCVRVCDECTPAVHSTPRRLMNVIRDFDEGQRSTLLPAAARSTDPVHVGRDGAPILWQDVVDFTRINQPEMSATEAQLGFASEFEFESDLKFEN